jgi:hypothetical protein
MQLFQVHVNLPKTCMPHFGFNHTDCASSSLYTGISVILRNSYISTRARPIPSSGLAKRALRQARPNDELLNEQYAINRTRTDFAWEDTTGSREIVIAVMDSGCGEWTRTWRAAF